jgi:hypothetical protein
MVVMAIFMCASPRPGEATELIVESGPGSLLGYQWNAAVLHYQPAAEAGRWQARLDGLKDPSGRPLGQIQLECFEVVVPVFSGCRDGSLNWQLEDLAVAARFQFFDLNGQREIGLTGQSWQLQVELPDGEPALASGRLEIDEFDLGDVPEAILALADMNLVQGLVSGQIELRDGSLVGQLEMVNGGFDSVDGLLAADGLVLTVHLEKGLFQPRRSFSLTLEQAAGELLAGSLYLPAPSQSLELDVKGQWLDDGGIWIDQWRLADAGAVEAVGSAMFSSSDEGWQVSRLAVEQAALTFPNAWERWIDGHAAAAGFGSLETRGRVELVLGWQPESPVTLRASFDEVSIDDPAQRFFVAGIQGWVDWRSIGPDAGLAWERLSVYGLELGHAGVRLTSDDDGARLVEPLRLPLFDGAIVIDHLQWNPVDETVDGFGFDARIEPLSLAHLTRAMEWPEFGGVLSGNFPGVVFADERIRVAGGIDMQAFSGRIRITDLAVERPFGTLPALAAQVELTRLDLLELTGAFNFGRMEGQMSGWMHDLRLLDWRPVAMDARLFTHEDARRRRISQRAVDNLSSLGGAGGALVTSTLLRVFEDFPYRRAGLACRLSNNICHIDGVAPHESGGFYIVEGRSLPRLDIIGHRRLVDWPQLINQLEGMMD